MFVDDSKRISTLQSYQLVAMHRLFFLQASIVHKQCSCLLKVYVNKAAVGGRNATNEGAKCDKRSLVKCSFLEIYWESRDQRLNGYNFFGFSNQVGWSKSANSFSLYSEMVCPVLLLKNRLNDRASENPVSSDIRS